jgi:hypothetical protein
LCPTAFAVDPAIKKQLEKLDPATRLEQSCDTEAMSRINKDETGYKPDKVIAYTFKDPVPSDDRLEAPRRGIPQQGRLVPSVLQLHHRPAAHQCPRTPVQDRRQGSA